MKRYGGADVEIHVFLFLALVGGEWLASRPCHITPRERAPSTHWIGDRANPRAGLDDINKWKFLTLLELQLQPLSCAACSQLLYQLHYCGSYQYM
jgi:hypothetical protein